MQSTHDVPNSSRKLLWTGRVISALVVLMLTFSAVMKLMKPVQVVEGFTHLGYPERLILILGVVELACTLLYAIPQTAVLGAILLTGYLGGATATHVRMGEPYFTPILIGVAGWLGLLLREPRLKRLLPLMR